MRRLYFLWMYAVTLTAFLVACVLSMLEEQRALKDAALRLSTLSSSIEESVILNYNARRYSRIAKLVDKISSSSSNKSFLGMALCHLEDGKNLRFGSVDEKYLCNSFNLKDSLTQKTDTTWTQSSLTQKLQFFSHPVLDSDRPDSSVILVSSQNITGLRTAWIESLVRIFLCVWLIGIAFLILVATQVRGWVKANFRFLHQTLHSMIAGKKPQPMPPSMDEPISREINSLAKKILSLNPNSRKKEPLWMTTLQDSMEDQNLIVIANREPYIHQKKGDQIEVVRPASGLVTALEPVLRQFGGTWVAHGGGTADRETANERGEVQVPPGNPKYTLKRVTLTKEEEDGYYYGFSNEGLWPLCHLAHNRPIFRLSDWEQYKSVNQKFADSIPIHREKENSLILVQDYHFALLPRLIRDKKDFGKNKIGIFWHIPWPNPEAFGICPWSRELLHGMLGSDVIGFHTQYHCNNFLETCNRYLEARIDWEHFSVTINNHETHVRAFPIGIDTAPVRTLNDDEVKALKVKYGIYAEKVAVGVDRLDYTKGLVERVESVERLLEKHPEYIGKFSLVQMGSPSRTHIPAYRALTELLETTVNRVNSRFGDSPSHPGYKPVVFLNQHHEWEEIQYFYQIGDLCMVTSLHDGMNLVAKEYVWCQKPERGSLVLSKFTGASRELTEAFIVNPYSIEELADAIAGAIALPSDEKARRMKSMKEKIQAHTAIHWAADLIRALLAKEENVVLQFPEPDLQDKFQSIKVV